MLLKYCLQKVFKICKISLKGNIEISWKHLFHNSAFSISHTVQLCIELYLRTKPPSQIGFALAFWLTQHSCYIHVQQHFSYNFMSSFKFSYQLVYLLQHREFLNTTQSATHNTRVHTWVTITWSMHTLLTYKLCVHKSNIQCYTCPSQMELVHKRPNHGRYHSGGLWCLWGYRRADSWEISGGGKTKI